MNSYSRIVIGSRFLTQESREMFPIPMGYDLEDTSSQNPIRHGISVLMNLVRCVYLEGRLNLHLITQTRSLIVVR